MINGLFLANTFSARPEDIPDLPAKFLSKVQDVVLNPSKGFVVYLLPERFNLMIQGLLLLFLKVFGIP